jgi:transcriptional regulator with GAF, ATPase, and Fis domain/tetratricopeptide (TPR) repeat protein
MNDFSVSSAFNATSKEHLLILGAILPPPVSLDALTAMSGLSPVEVLRDVEALISKQTLRPYKEKGPGFYYFPNVASPRRILGALPENTLHALVDEVVRYVDETVADCHRRSLIITHIHHLTGLLPNRLADFLTAAGQCLETEALEAAGIYFRMVLNALSGRSLTAKEKVLYTDAALGMIASSGHIMPLDQQKDILNLARKCSLAIQDQERLCQVDLRLAQVVKIEGDYTHAGHLYEEAWDLAEKVDREDLRRQAAFFTTDFLFWQGLVKDAVSRYEEAIGNLEELPSDPATLRACAALGWCYGICGQIARGIGLLKAVRNRAERLHMGQITVYADLMSVLTYLEAHRMDEAESHLNQIFSHPEASLGNYVLWAGYASRAFVQYAKGDLEGCYEYQKKAHEKAKEFGWHHHRGPWNFEYMDALEAAGMVHQEMNYDSEILRIRDWPDVYMRGVGLRYDAQRLLKKGRDRETAVAKLKESAELLIRAGARIELARTQILLARQILKDGDDAKARELLGEAWQVFSGVNESLFPDELRPYLDEADEDILINTIVEVADVIGTVMDRNRLLERIINRVMRLTLAGRGGFFLTDDQGGCDLVASRNLDLTMIETDEFESVQKMLDRVAHEKKELILESAEQGSHPQSAIHEGWALCVPVLLRDRLLGMIYLDNLLVSLSPPKRSLSLLRVINRHLAVALDNARAYEEIARLKDRLEDETQFYRMEMESFPHRRQILGDSPVIRAVLEQIDRVSPTDAAVLITGETGVGKELVARAIHRLSRRNGNPFIPVNTASLEQGVIASELFGHEKGAFTGALKKRRGRFELADHGTLFLDDVDTLPMDIQTRILRALQEKEFERVGGDRTVRSDFRLISATNQDLAELVKQGRFRADLYYRLNVFPIHVPPLQSRKEDIPLLVSHFLSLNNNRLGKSIKGIRQGDMERLKAYGWPGNVRELEHIVERAAILNDGEYLRIPELSTGGSAESYSECLRPLREMEREAILKALQKSRWRVSGKGGAAEMLDLKPTTLYAKMRKLEIRKNLKYE